MNFWCHARHVHKIQIETWCLHLLFLYSFFLSTCKSLGFSQAPITLPMESNLNLESYGCIFYLANFPGKCILSCTKLLWLQGLNFEGFEFPSLATLISSKVNSAKTFEAKEKVQWYSLLNLERHLRFWFFFLVAWLYNVKQLLKFHSQSCTDNYCSHRLSKFDRIRKFKGNFLFFRVYMAWFLI